jgi:hypothetical protein
MILVFPVEVFRLYRIPEHDRKIIVKPMCARGRTRGDAKGT